VTGSLPYRFLVPAAVVSVLCGFVVYQWFSSGPDSHSPVSVIGQQRPDFALPDLDGNVHTLDEWDGRVIALNFWATWCPPCRTEIPEFIALQRRYSDRGLQFIGIALQTAEEAAPFVQEYGINYPVLAGLQPVVEVARAFGNRIGALPYTVFIDRSGRIAHVHAGPLSGDEAERLLLPLL